MEAHLEIDSMDTSTTDRRPGSGPARWLAAYFSAPFRRRSWARLIYLVMAPPAGLFYFVFLLLTGSLGLSLLALGVGLLFLAVFFLAVRGFSSLERELAILLLDQDVPPLSPTVAGAADRPLVDRLASFLGRSTTWTGLGFLVLKAPLGLATFLLLLVPVTVVGSLLVAPWVVFEGSLGYRVLLPFGEVWQIDTATEAFVLFTGGLLAVPALFHLWNGLARGWGWLAGALLGSESLRRQAAGGP